MKTNSELAINRIFSDRMTGDNEADLWNLPDGYG